MSRHDDALSTLGSWSPPDQAQAALRDLFVRHLEQHGDGTERSCFPAHLTAGTVVLSDDGEQVLLNLHRKAGRWFAFGGHCEPQDATLAATALREAQEESGLHTLRFDPVPLGLDEHTVEFCDPRGAVHHLDVRYGATTPRDADIATSAESLDVRWWPVDALPDLEDEMVRLIELARDRWGTRTRNAEGVA